jgi:hypothetical protein
VEGSGECHLRHGETKAGAAHLNQALEIFQRLAMPAGVDRVQMRLASLTNPQTSQVTIELLTRFSTQPPVSLRATPYRLTCRRKVEEILKVIFILHCVTALIFAIGLYLPLSENSCLHCCFCGAANFAHLRLSAARLGFCLLELCLKTAIKLPCSMAAI